MPRMLTPRNDSFRGRKFSNSSFGSRSSMGSYASARTSLNALASESQFSLRRPPPNNASAQSSSCSLQRTTVQHHRPRVAQPSSDNHNQNAVWNFVDIDQDSVSRGPPSLVSSSDLSLQTGISQLSLSSSQASPSSVPVATASQARRGARREALKQFYAFRRSSMVQQQHKAGYHYHAAAGLPSGSTGNHYAHHRGSLQHPTILHPTNEMPRTSARSTSFLPSARIMEEDVWGQFVDTAVADEELVRRSKILSMRRYPPIRGGSYPALSRAA